MESASSIIKIFSDSLSLISVLSILIFFDSENGSPRIENESSFMISAFQSRNAGYFLPLKLPVLEKPKNASSMITRGQYSGAITFFAFGLQAIRAFVIPVRKY